MLDNIPFKGLFIIAFISGALSVLAYSPFDFWFVELLSLCNLLFLIYQNTAKHAALLAFSWGMGQFLFGVSWTYVSIQQFGGVSPSIAISLIILLAAYLSLYPLLFGYLWRKLFNHHSPAAQLLLIAPALWLITDSLRGTIFGGFPWLFAGYTQINGPLISLAPILGMDFITLLLMLISGTTVLAIHQRSFRITSMVIMLLTAPLLLKFIHWTTIDTSRKVSFALIQGNTDQALKWSKAHLDSIIGTYSQLVLSHLGKQQIIILPEAAIPDIELNQQSLLTEWDQLSRTAHSALVVGLMNYIPTSRDIYNSVIVLGDKHPYSYPTKNRYNKHYLVPFGETVPFKFLFNIVSAILAFPMSNLSEGDYIQAPLSIQGFNFITAICYEIIRNQQLRDNFTPETDFILTVSNDTWFGRSIGPWQHLQMARMRAIELGRPVIRATNNGITAIIDTNGEIMDKLPQFQKSTLTYTLSPATGLTPFVRYGTLPTQIIVLFMLSLPAILKRIKAKWV